MREVLPASLALGVAVLGTAAMTTGLLLGRVLGLHLTLVVSETLLMAPGLLALALGGVPLARGLALSILDRRTTLLCMGAGATLWVASLGLLELQYAVWPPPEGYLEAFRRLHEALRPANPFDALLSVLAIAVAPAVCEEILARGICLPSFRHGLGDAGAVVASAVVFGLMHLDLYRLLFAFAVGLALGVLRLRTGVLVPTILAHATLNTLTFATAPFLDDPAQGLPDPRPLLGAGLLGGGSVATLLLMRTLGPSVDSPSRSA